jgi:hypothetical protein
MSFASSNEINAIAVENRKFHKQTMVNWMNRTAADPIFKYLAAEVDKNKDEILADLVASAKTQYIPSVPIFRVGECVFDKKSGCHEDCRNDPVIIVGPCSKQRTVLEHLNELRPWCRDTPAEIIPEEFWAFGSKAPNDQNDFFQTLKDSDTLRLLENHLGDNFSCHVNRKETHRFSQWTEYHVEVSVQFHLTKRPDWRKEQISAAVKRYDMRQKAIAEDCHWDRWQELYEEDKELAAQHEAIPYPYVNSSAFEKANRITERRKVIYHEMYPEDGPEYDQDDLNKMDLQNRRGF